MAPFEMIQFKVDSWIREQGEKVMKFSWAPFQWRIKWPPWTTLISSNNRKRIKLEYERQKQKLNQLCLAVKADSVSELQEILCCMVLAECVYKRPAVELIRAVNKFKADFGSQLVCLERVQPSSDHVPHRYLLAEAGDTLFASFIGSKQYKDFVTDVNILQGAIFHDDPDEELRVLESSDTRGWNPLQGRIVGMKDRSKPAAHRGFLARAKGIPALELYKLAKKKKKKLVLCGHSLGGAVAALATLAILRGMATSSSKVEELEVKCITFSQPPVGNAALKDYVHRKGWHRYFRSYCIPEDLVPRILSPAYFHHYNRANLGVIDEPNLEGVKKSRAKLASESTRDHLVLGLGPVQTSLWRLLRLVHLENIKHGVADKKPIMKKVSSENAVEQQSLEIQEGLDGISLRPILDTNSLEGESGKLTGSKTSKNSDTRAWQRVPSLPSYVPFGKLYLLGNSSVDLLSGAEYSKLTSVKSVISELRERFQSHTMRSYRSRFQRIYEACMRQDTSSFFQMEDSAQFLHLQKWLGVSVAGAVELADIVESPVVKSATSLVPINWSGNPGDKNWEPMKVDIMGFRLHLCSLVHAQINGHWCSTTVESWPSSSQSNGQDLVQRMRVLVGAPLKKPPKHLDLADSISDFTNQTYKKHHPDGLNDIIIHFTSDFATVSKEVNFRTRRVRLLGLKGAGKTSLFWAIMRQQKQSLLNLENLHKTIEDHEGFANGLFYLDTNGVNLHNVGMEVSRFRNELQMGIFDLSKKTDLIILVHNLSHIIPQWSNSTKSPQQPVLSLLLNEAKALGIPWVLAITNKFALTGSDQKEAIDSVLHAYQASHTTTEVLDSSPHPIPTAAASASLSWTSSPVTFLLRALQKTNTNIPVDGVQSLCHLVHRVLKLHEESSSEELAKDGFLKELSRERNSALHAKQAMQDKDSSFSAAAVGASLGACLGFVFALVMGAGSALRKP